MSDIILLVLIVGGGIFTYSQLYPNEFKSLKQSFFPTNPPIQPTEEPEITPLNWIGDYLMYSLDDNNNLYNTEIIVSFDSNGKIISNNQEINNMWAPYIYTNKKIKNVIKDTFYPVVYSNGTINIYSNNKIVYSFIRYIPTSPPPVPTKITLSSPPVRMAGNWQLFQNTNISITLEPDGSILSSDPFWDKNRYDNTGFVYFENAIYKNEINTAIDNIIIVYEGTSRNIRYIMKKMDNLSIIATEAPIPTLVPLLNKPSPSMSGYWKVYKTLEPIVTMLLKSDGSIESRNTGWNNAKFDATRLTSSSGSTVKDISVNSDYNLIQFLDSSQLLFKIS